MESVKIIAFGVAAAIVYGILHNQVTAHLCVEYFTIGHPAIFATETPFLLAIGWGVLATWWIGLPFGIGLALAARSGTRPRLLLRDLRRPILALMLVSAAAALMSGLLGAALAASGLVVLVHDWATLIPREKHVVFLADAWAHAASYAAGLIGGIALIVHTVRRRGGADPRGN